MARLLVVTTYKDKINKKTSVLIEGKAYDLIISEDESADFLSDEIIHCSCRGWPEKINRVEMG